MNITVHSNIGKRRTTNQDYADYFQNNFGQHLFILCDGVGGHQSGDVASRETCRFIGEQFKNMQDALTSQTVDTWLNTTIEAVNQFIYEQSMTASELSGMSTTLVMATIIEDTIKIAHVGDSRAYGYHNHAITLLTQDHSLVNELMKTGEISYEDSLTHPHRHAVTRCIGSTEDALADITTVALEQVSLLLLCSDGLSNMVSAQQMCDYFDKMPHDEQLGEALIAAANEAGGSDNISLILVSQFAQLDEEVTS
ncbi:MAG: Stp1/IreP family PP2C-type Ser/Thr phosphatase [Aerococcaceae bacterium]|nr:Stp1/IreP family PP2C-type Ser/Thr phosphatase [Aerococcaceae bacterium]